MMTKLENFWIHVRAIWAMISKPVLLSFILWIVMAIAFLLGTLTVTGAFVLGTGAVLAMIVSLREE